jgi:lipoprotein NlpD
VSALSRPALHVSALMLAACAARMPAPVEDRSPAARAAPAESPTSLAPAEQAVVARGDTLYGIAFRHGLDWRNLARWNGIGEPYTIFPGQVLRLTPPERGSASAARPAPAAPALAEERPARREALAPQTPAPSAAPPAAAAASPPAAAPGQAPVPGSPRPADPAAPAPVAASPSRPASEPGGGPSAAEGTTAGAAAPAQAPGVDTPRGAPSRSVEGIRWTWPAEGAILRTFVAGDPLRQGIDIGGRAGDSVRAAADGVVVYSGSGLVGYGELVIIKHDDRYLSAYGHNRRRLVAEGERVRAGQPIAEMGRTGAERDKLHFEIRRDGRPVDPLRYLPPR